MSTEILCIRTASGAFYPMGDDESEKAKKIKAGCVVAMSIKRVRNPLFLRKWFALVKFAYSIWSERAPKQEYKGVEVRPEFERFRKDIIIMCGHYRPTFAINGEVRLEAESISFASMDEERFETLYSATINVILGKILDGTGITETALRDHVERVLRFD